MKIKHSLRTWIRSKRVGLGVFLAFIFFFALKLSFLSDHGIDNEKEYPIKRAEISAALDAFQHYPFPEDVELGVSGEQKFVKMEYTIDPELHQKVDRLVRSYSPDYASIVVMDAETGKVLILYSYDKGDRLQDENLSLRATFPSASVFKIVTAAAAIAERNYSADTVISFLGGNHTLYKRNVFTEPQGRWVRRISLEDAFARSVNTVFGKIGAIEVGASTLRKYATQFGFDQKLDTDLPVQTSHAWIPEDDVWGLVETSSGFTRKNLMSPLQGALIASTVIQNGVMMQPYVVKKATSEDGEILYEHHPSMMTQVMDPEVAGELQKLMVKTVEKGTSRSAFRGFGRGKWKDVHVGGKTGSLTGLDPRGKYDWFVGYAESKNRKLSICALTINIKNWRVKSSYLARKTIEYAL